MLLARFRPRAVARGAVLAISLTCTIATANAQVRMARIFGDHMVIQRDKPVRVWGQAGAAEGITVQFGDQRVDGRADPQGSWSVTLAAMDANSVGSELVIQGRTDRVVISDVLVGEVWICGGQSNMEWTLRSSRDADVEIPSADLPQMRYIRLPKIARLEAQADFPAPNPKGAEGKWRACTPEHVANCTGVGYYFGRRLHRRLRVPVGLIDTSWGGTMAQHWVPRPKLREIPEMKRYFAEFEARLKTWVDGGREAGAKRRYESDVKRWEKERVEAKRAGKREPRRPRDSAYENPGHQRQPGGMFNGVIAPLAGLTIRGALFYQGENNSFTEGWKPFPKTFPAVIAAWRAAFRDPKLPVGLIQIAGWSNRRTMKYDMNHHTNIVREVQHRTWRATERTGLIVTFDTNSNQSIHPGRKLPVGERTARWALAEVYGIKAWQGKALEWKGPIYESMEVVGKKIVVSFEKDTVRGLRLDQDAELGFYIAGADRTFHVARARVIKGGCVEVWSDDVPEPVAVRYGWSNLPLGSLMNARELPAYPFRSDTWPLVPHQSTGAYEVGS